MLSLYHNLKCESVFFLGFTIQSVAALISKVLTWIWTEIPEVTLDVGEEEIVGILYPFNVILQIGVGVNLLSEFQVQVFDDLSRFPRRSSIKRMLF